MRPSFHPRRILLSALLLMSAIPAQAQGVMLPAVGTTQKSSTIALADLPARIMACSKQSTESVRLRCFDETAASVDEMTRAASVHNQFAWSLRSTGAGRERKTTIAISSSDAVLPANLPASKNGFFLAGSCMDGQTNFYLAFPDTAYSTPKKVIMHRDGNESTSMTMYPSDSGKAMGLWSNESALEFLNDVSTVNTISFDFKDERMPVTILFDLRGMPEALHNMQTSCVR